MHELHSVIFAPLHVSRPSAIAHTLTALFFAKFLISTTFMCSCVIVFVCVCVRVRVEIAKFSRQIIQVATPELHSAAMMLVIAHSHSAANDVRSLKQNIFGIVGHSRWKLPFFKRRPTTWKVTKAVSLIDEVFWSNISHSQHVNAIEAIRWCISFATRRRESQVASRSLE